MLEIDFTKRFCILGLGLSGMAAVDFLLTKKVSRIFISESKKFEDLSSENQVFINNLPSFIECEFGLPHTSKYLEYDYLIISPSFPPESQILQKAKEKNIVILTEIDLALSEDIQIIGITGTNGKSTITAWTAHVLSSIACGNIGLPLCKAVLDNSDLKKPFICELSSFQLTHSNFIKPNIASITNITADHLIWHGGWDNYLQAKFKITALQDSADWLILPDNELFWPLTKITKAQVLWLTSSNNSNQRENAAFIDEQNNLILSIKGQKTLICNANDIKLAGKHNLENALIVAANAYLSKLISLDNLKQKLISFEGLAHRLEFVREIKGKRFFNDSKATNPESSMVALNAFDADLILLAGGEDKMTDLTDFCKLANQKASAIILYGKAAKRFKDNLMENGFQGYLKVVSDLQMALNIAYIDRLEKNILLSPACASFDQFKNFESRGNYFKQLINDL